MNSNSSAKPQDLYKIISNADWTLSKGQELVKLSAMDDEFIHLATFEQLPNILKKFWPNDNQALILKLDVSKLKGRLLKERNPGGTTEYYHLYEGSIPTSAVISVLSRSELSK